jgi:DNA-binding NarL/FixJ family response regulator
MSRRPIRVLIADDHPMIRKGVADICRDRGGFEVVGEAADGREAVEMALELHPDVVVMDIRMPVLDGIRATAELVKADAEARVIMLTMHRDDRSVLGAIRAGARGYVLKTTDADVMVEAIRLVHRGEALVDSAFALRILQDYRRQLDPGSPAAPGLDLTDGEMSVLRLVARGMDNTEIAKALSIAPSTVGNRLSQIYLKLGVSNRTQAALEALRRGWASLDEGGG